MVRYIPDTRLLQAGTHQLGGGVAEVWQEEQSPAGGVNTAAPLPRWLNRQKGELLLDSQGDRVRTAAD